MNEPTLYLEPVDDLGSVLSKISRLKSSHFILVIPKGAALMHSPLNLKILKRYLDDAGRVAKIGIADQVGSAFARAAEFELAIIPAAPASDIHSEDFDADANLSIDDDMELVDGASLEVESAPLRPSIKRGKWALASSSPFANLTRSISATRWRLKLSRQHQITLGLTLVGVAMLLSVGYFVVPRAVVTLEVPSEAFNKQFALVLADAQDLQAAGANILTGRFLEVTRENVASFPATGEQNNGDKASGQLTVLNYTGSITGLLANTRFQAANGMIFRLKTDVLVPPARGSAPGKTIAEAVADEGGIKYNVAPPMKLTVPGLTPAAQELVYGEITSAFTGGTDDITKVVSQADIDKAKEEAAKNVFVATEADLNKQLKRGEELVSNFIQNDVIDSTPNVNVGATTDQFEMRVQSRSWTLAIKKGALSQAVANAAAFEVPEGKQVTQQTVDTAKVEVVEGNFITHRINLTVALDGRVGPQLDVSDILSRLANQPIEVGKQYLQGRTDIASSEITIWPEFMPRIPLLLNNIKVSVIYLGE